MGYRLIKRILIISVILMIFGCAKEPGIGGNSSISGQIILKKYNSSMTQIVGTYPAADHYVYIVYGDHVGYDKRIKTDYDGQFEFNYLYPGNYKIYTYSTDSTGSVISGQVPVIVTIDLQKREHHEIPKMYIFE